MLNSQAGVKPNNPGLVGRWTTNYPNGTQLTETKLWSSLLGSIFSPLGGRCCHKPNKPT